MNARNPYTDLPPRAFWRSAVAEPSFREMTNLWRPKFPVTRYDSILTAGSCFAQHLSRALVKHGFDWIDAEPGPERAPHAERRLFGYGVFSFRTGNIYTAALLRRWVEAAFGVKPLGDELWTSDGRWFDPLRPAIEPGGFASNAELMVLRATTLAAIRRALTTSTLFVFTLGLTEGWRNARTSDVYAMCPGTQGGMFDPDAHEFALYDYADILADLEATLDLIARHNGEMRFLLTVSPVPLTATASGDHILVASTHAKSVLRAVAGTLQRRRADTDYFPAYEIVTNPAARSRCYEANLRSVRANGVDLVMSQFFAGIGMAGDGDVPAAQSTVALAARGAAQPADVSPTTAGVTDFDAEQDWDETEPPVVTDDDDNGIGRRTIARARRAPKAERSSKPERSNPELACEEAMLDAFGPIRTTR